MTTTLYIAVREDAPFTTDARGPTEAEVLRERLREAVGELLVATGSGGPVGTARVTARFGSENGRADMFTRVGDDPMAEQIVRKALAVAGGADLGSYAVAAVFEVSDPMVAESLAWDVVFKLRAQDRIALYFKRGETEATPNDAYKSIEVFYDIEAIPPGYSNPLDFRNDAMSHVERALEDAGAGTWAGAEIGMGEVNFGFEVEDFERSERIVRAAVKGTPYEGIREITRFLYPNNP